MSVKSKKYAVVDDTLCVACGCCVSVCPLSAIKVHCGSYAVIDETKCVGCGKCSTACPASVIEIEVRQ